MPPTSESHWSPFPVGPVMSSDGLMTYGGIGASTSSPELSPPGTSTQDDGCAVCGDRVNGKRYGAPACLGCIVFFRRAVTNDVTYKCLKGGTCVITNESRCICRYCRLQKCYTVGMKASAIQRRDVMGPRKPKAKEIKNEVDDTPNLKCISNPSSTSSITDRSPMLLRQGQGFRLMDTLVRLQRYQISKHHEFFAAHETMNLDGDLASCEYFKLNDTQHRRARAQDVNCMLKLGIIDAATWGNQFEPFRRLSSDEKKHILTEYGFTFMLVDQGYKTAKTKKRGFWMLQNDTFMHEDYFFGLPPEDAKKENAATKAKLHPLFVNESLNCVGYPFEALEIDEFECVVLKTILLLTQQGIFKDHQSSVRELSNRCMVELMDYAQQKCPETAVERFGTVILLTSSIRCSINALYNQTRVSDVFDLMKFDPLIKNVILS
uniref:Nuclear receptor domain-containing protein n=1 Tax=Caenorhabditis tropicalis TaxID=1561998 RepID=A0A1I7TPW5_9PELO